MVLDGPDEAAAPVRAHVVRALSDALIDMDVAALTAASDATEAEKRAAVAVAAEHSAGLHDHHERETEAVELLVRGGMRPGMSWAAVWAAQPDDLKARLVDLYDALPADLVPEVDAWREQSGT